MARIPSVPPILVTHCAACQRRLSSNRPCNLPSPLFTIEQSERLRYPMTTDAGTWVGQMLDNNRYKVADKLGEGGMGFVYRARDRRLGCDVVIKVPRAEMLADAEFRQRFAQEIRALVKLSHPHVVKVTDVGKHDGVPFAVMQFLPGGSLEDNWQKGANSA